MKFQTFGPKGAPTIMLIPGLFLGAMRYSRRWVAFSKWWPGESQNSQNSQNSQTNTLQ